MCCHNTLLKTSGSNKTKGSSTDVFLTFQPWEKKKSAELCSVTPPPKWFGDGGFPNAKRSGNGGMNNDWWGNPIIENREAPQQNYSQRYFPNPDPRPSPPEIVVGEKRVGLVENACLCFLASTHEACQGPGRATLHFGNRPNGEINSQFVFQ